MKTFGTFLLLIIAITAYGQSGLKGHVTYDDNNPFVGLDIEVLNQDSTVALTHTDMNGDYLINNLKPGLYTLRIRFIGFRERIIKNVSIASNEIRQFDFTHPGPCIESVKICPSGNHTDNLIPIAYGLPGKRLMKKYKKGKVRLGGCIVTDCDPMWYCKEHAIEF